MNSKLATQLRSKKLGVLIQDARLVAGRTKRECADALGISTSTLSSFESGRKSPSLPELEALAYFLNVPFEHFWGNTALSESPETLTTEDRIANSILVRNQSIAEKIQEMRQDSGLSYAEFARQTGISKGRIKKYETAEQPVPILELEIIAQALDSSLQDFIGDSEAVSEWLREQKVVQQFLDMPEELQEFVSKHYNRPYIELAHKLSAMEANKLRSVAEGLLDITL